MNCTKNTLPILAASPRGKKEMEHGEINYIHFFSQAQNRLAEHSNLLILNVPMQISSLE